MKTSKAASLTPVELRKRLHTVQGQINGIIRMCEEGAPCVEALAQFKAARAGLDRALALYMQENLRRCMEKGVSPKKQKEMEIIIHNLVA